MSELTSQSLPEFYIKESCKLIKFNLKQKSSVGDQELASTESGDLSFSDIISNPSR